MKNLKYFIFGIIFYIAAIPIIESVAEIISTCLELLKGKASAPVLKLNKDLLKLQSDLEKHDEGVAIGFDIKSSEDYDDDFEDRKKNNKKR